ncbi:MAG: hydrogenase maturation protease [Chloroflexi bacterium]|nr:hydrogenase maturation protease [Chloroflexota bacterium]
MKDVRGFLKEKSLRFKKSEITIIGLGNIYRSDDGFGIEAAQRLKKAGFAGSYSETDCIDEIILELCNKKIPGLIIFLDSSDFEGRPGELKIFSKEDIDDETGSHKIPVKLYMKLLGKSGKQSYLIAVKPETLENKFEPSMSVSVDKAITDLVSNLCNQFDD